MASNEDTSKQVITPVPERLLGFIRTRVASYLSQGNNFSADIYQVDGQAARLVIKASKYKLSIYGGINVKNDSLSKFMLM